MSRSKRYNGNELKNKEWLIEQYITRSNPCSKIAISIGCSISLVLKYLKIYNIPVRSASEAKMGSNNPMYGKKASPETKALLSFIRKGKKHSEEWCKNISKALTGNPNNCHKCSEETKKKLSIANKGMKISQEHRKAISKAQKGPKLYMRGSLNPAKRPEVRIKLSGPNSCHWKGGISRLPYCEKWTPELRERIRSFFNYECILCGKSQEENITRNGKLIQLSCHHVYYNKSACCDDSPMYFAPLCIKCHAKTGHNRNIWQEIIHRIIDEIYDGKSYYTSDEYNELI